MHHGTYIVLSLDCGTLPGFYAFCACGKFHKRTAALTSVGGMHLLCARNLLVSRKCDVDMYRMAGAGL